MTRHFDALTWAATEEPTIAGEVYPNYPADLTRWASHIEAEANGHLDAAQVFVCAHWLLGLTRIATGRDGLNLLETWLSPRFSRVDPRLLMNRTTDWLEQQALHRMRALEEIDAASWRLVAERLDDFDVAADVRMQECEIADLRESRMSPACLSDFSWVKPRSAHSRALTAAVRSYAASYPWRVDPLDTLARVRAARPLRSVQQ